MSLWEDRMGRRLRQGTDDTVAEVARMQDSAVDQAQLPPLPGDPGDSNFTPEQRAWIDKHPQGLDLGSNEGQLAKLRAARDAVRGKRPTVEVGRPDMPSGAPRAFADISPPGDGSPDVAMSQTKVAGDRVSAPADSDMLDAQMLANGRRTREAIYEASRQAASAGLGDAAQKRALTSSSVAGNLDAPVKELQADRAYKQKQREEARAAEDQGFQRETQGFNREKMGQARTEFGSKQARIDPRSDVSARRRAEAIGLYPKEVGRIDPETWKNATAEDVDVILKELNMQKDRSSARASQQALNTFLRRSDALGKGSQQFGELDQLEAQLNEMKGKGKDLNLGIGDKLLMGLPGGAGESFVDSDKARYSHLLDDLQAQVGYMRSGKVITDREEANVRGILGRLRGQPAAAQEAGLRQIFQELHQRQRDFQAPYADPRGALEGQTPLDAHESRGGTSYRNPAGGGPQRKRGSDGQMYINRSGQPGDWEAE